MARKDARALREEAQTAASAGKHKRALECYVELERLEAGDPQWPKRAGDMLRKLGKEREAIAAYDRAVDRYAQSGFVVQAIAMCRLILQIDPMHHETARRLADMTEQQESGRTRIGALALQQAQVTDEDVVIATARSARAPASIKPAAPPPQVGDLELDLEPAKPAKPAAKPAPPTTRPRDEIAELSLDPETIIPITTADLESVHQIARIATRAVPAPGRARRPSAPAGPIDLAHGAPIDTVRLGRIAPGALEQKLPDGSLTGISVIPLDEDEPIELEPDPEPAPPPLTKDDDEIEELSLDEVADVAEMADAEIAAPRAWSNAAKKALAQTPLFSGLGHDALESLMTRIGLVSLEPGEILFREGEPGDTLYIVAEGEVGVAREGPPRSPVARLGPGSFFGEVALITDQPRNATVEAIAPRSPPASASSRSSPAR